MYGDENYKKWLESLKVGDKVAVAKHSYGSKRYIFTTITKITPKKAVRVEYGERLFKDGYVGTHNIYDSTSYYLEPITEELLKEEELKKKLGIIYNFKFWNKLDEQSINIVYDLISKHFNIGNGGSK